MKKLLILLLLLSACAVAPVPTASPEPATPPSVPTPTDTPWPPPTREGTVVPSDAVTLRPGDPLQARIDAAEPGATFVFAPGVYERAHIRPRTGDAFVAEPGAVLDGMGSTYFAFQALDQPNDPDRPRGVTVRGFEVRGYVSHTSAESSRSPDGAIDGAEGWVIEDNYVHHNKAGISLGRGNWGWGDGATVRRNAIVDNLELGVEINGANILLEQNEIARNGYGLSEKAADWMGAALKATDQPVWADSTFKTFIRLERNADDHLVIQDNHSHHNNGMGLWLDVYNRNALLEQNLVEFNRSSGIFDELSSGTIIRNNVVRLNRLNNTNTGLWGGGEIFAANSSGGLVENNTIVVSSNGRGVVLVDESYRTPRMAAYSVLDNDITYEALPKYGASIYEPVAGISGGGGNAPFRDAGNVFDGNRYTLPPGADTTALYFYWDGGLSLSGFRAAGHEARGVVTVAALRSAAPVSFAETMGEVSEDNMDVQTIQQIIQLVAFVVTIVVMLVVLRASTSAFTAFVAQAKDNPAMVAAFHELAMSFPPGTPELVKQLLIAGKNVTDDEGDALIDQINELIDKALAARGVVAAPPGEGGVA